MQISTSPKKLSRFRGRGHRLASFKPTLEPLEERTLLNAGALDQTFGMNGEVMSNFSLSNFTTALLQTDGKIVVVGSAGPSVSILALARYNPDGSLDSSFGMGGVEYSPLIGGAAAAALQADGAILVAGGRNEESVLARFTTSGVPDSTFGTGGSVTTSIPELTGVAVAPDGKIILAGFGNPPPSYSSTIELQRYNPNGTLDTTFGSGGTATDPAGGAQSSRLLTQPDGKILLVETIGGTMANGYITPFLVKRYNADGSVDQGFQVPVNVGTGFNAAEDVALQAGGKIVALGFSGPLVRLNPDGSLDAGFGVKGQLSIGFGDRLAVQADGEIVVANTNGAALVVARYQPDGSLETRFGVAGTASAPFFANNFGSVAAVMVQADGKIVVAASGPNSDPGPVHFIGFVLARFVGGPAGSLTGTPNQRFVQQLYLDVLGRVADPGGLASWTGLLDRGMANRTQVAAAIDSSHESHTLVVQALYRRLLVRPVDSSGQAIWAGFLDQGGTAEQLAAILMGSDEYKRDHMLTPTGFVDALYRAVLHRYADSAGQQSWQQAVDSGVSHQAIAAAFLATGESDQDEVQELYHRFQHRQADAAGLMAFENALQHGVANEQVTAALLGSDEYFQLAQQ